MTADQTTVSSHETNEGADDRTVASHKATSASGRNQKATLERDLKSVSVVKRSSAEKANIAFQIEFTVPIQGRYPTSSASC